MPALAILLGVGQIVLPAAAWCAAIILARADRLAFAAVTMAAGIGPTAIAGSAAAPETSA